MGSVQHVCQGMGPVGTVSEFDQCFATRSRLYSVAVPAPGTECHYLHNLKTTRGKAAGFRIKILTKCTNNLNKHKDTLLSPPRTTFDAIYGWKLASIPAPHLHFCAKHSPPARTCLPTSIFGSIYTARYPFSAASVPRGVYEQHPAQVRQGFLG
jgi:hypothetical protein